MNSLVLWRTHEIGVPLKNRRQKKYEIAHIKTMGEVEKADVKSAIYREFRNFMIDLTEIQLGKGEKILPVLSFDFIVIEYLRDFIRTLKIPISESLTFRIKKDSIFAKTALNWYIQQGWDFTGFDDIVEKLSSQYILLMVNKLLFYGVVRDRYYEIKKDLKIFGLPKDLPKIRIPRDLSDGGILRRHLEAYFDKILKIDYETIYFPDFFDNIDLPDIVVPQVRNLVDELSKYDFSKVNFEIIGNIFQSLIPERERHKLGQYFTRSDVVDLIVGTTIISCDDYILDPSCGAGTFLVRAYSRLKNKGFRGPHREFLEKLWGIDIARFPAHLSTINLATRDLSETQNYPRIAHMDFFDLIPHTPLTKSKFVVKNLSSEDLEKELPTFDAILTNPPYTRNEEMEDRTRKDYKKDIVSLLEKETGVKIGSMCSIYTHFFFHGAQFINNKGRMGLITSNSWLSVNYGRFLQEFFLKNFKIRAIIESKLERWFPEPDINTCIVILEKCIEKDKRDENLVKFVQLQREIPRILEEFSEKEGEYETWDDDKRWKAIDRFYEFLYSSKNFIQDSRRGIRIYSICQKDLWSEGYDTERNFFIGSKWGKYTKAPDVFYRKLVNNKLLVQLTKVANVNLGITSGRNEFFYLSKKRIDDWGLEDGFLKPLVKTPKECKKFVVDISELKLKVMIISDSKKELNGTHIYRYILWGEKQRILDSPFFRNKNKENWYILECITAPIIQPYQVDKRHFAAIIEKNICIDKQLVAITPNQKGYEKVLCAILNSTLCILFKELYGRTSFGLGSLQLSVTDTQRIPVIDTRKLDQEIIKKLEEAFNILSRRNIENIFNEIGTRNVNEVSLTKVKEDRRNLDKIVFGVLGLNENEQLEIYQSVVDLVDSRMKKAKSVKKVSKRRYDVNIKEISDLVIMSVDQKPVREIASYEHFEYVEKEVPSEGEISVNVDLFGNSYLQVGNERIETSSLNEAFYLKFMKMFGNDVIRIPNDERIMEELVKKMKELDEQVKDNLNDILMLTISDKKLRGDLRRRLLREVWNELGRRIHSKSESLS